MYIVQTDIDVYKQETYLIYESLIPILPTNE